MNDRVEASTRTSRLFIAAIIVICVMGVVNLVALLDVRASDNQLHANTTPELLLAQRIQFEAADMNGAQNLYLLDKGRSRAEFLADERRLSVTIGSARNADSTAVDRRMVDRISVSFHRFVVLDGDIWAALLRGDLIRARAQASGPETAIYHRMAADAGTLVRQATAERDSAIGHLNRAERIAIGVLLALDAIALCLVAAALVERRRTGQRLARREAEHQSLITQLPAATRVYDSHRGRLTFASPQYFEMYGLPPHVIDSDAEIGWVEHVHPDDRKRVVEGWRDAVRDGVAWHDRYRFVRDDGTTMWVSDLDRPIAGAAHRRLGVSFDVTEMIEMREQLDSTSVTHATLVDRMPLVLYHDSADESQPLYVSPGLTTILGYEPEQWFAHSGVGRWREHVHPDDLPGLFDAAQVVGDHITAPQFAVQARVRCAWGEYRWMEIEEVAIDEGPDRPRWRQGIVRDIHEQMVAEHRYEDLINRVPATVAIWNPDSETLLFISEQFRDLTGEDPATWLGVGGLAWWAAHVHPDDRGDGPARPAPGDQLPSLYRWYRPDGRMIWVREILAVQPGPEHNLIALLSDVTAEVEAERELADQRRRFELLVEQLPVVTYVSDKTGATTYVSPQVERLLGYTPAEYLALGGPTERAGRLIVPADAPRAREAMAGLRAGASDEVDEPLRMMTKTGDVRYVQLLARALHDETGVVTEVQGVIVDLTALRMAELRSHEVTAALVNAAEAEQARIATELHDDTVQVMAALLMQLRLSLRDAPKLARFEQILVDALDRTRRLMFEIRPQILESEGLGAALTAIARDGPWADAEGAFVDVTLPRQSHTTEAIVYRAVRELILNARKHSRATRLRISGRERDGMLVFEVEDNGVGFDAGSALDRKRMALHLGLDATMERLRLAGGSLEIDSAPGKGARFVLTVPADPSRATPRPDESELLAPG